MRLSRALPDFNRLVVSLILILQLAACGGGSNSPLTGSPEVTEDSAIPELALWREHMLTFGRANCEALQNNSESFDQLLNSTYYDAQWVFYQIADYTGDDSWLACAEAAERVYRDQFVLPSGGQIPGYWVFSHGLAEDFLRTGDEASKSALTSLAQNAAFAGDATPLAETAHALLSREVAYTIMTYINFEKAGGPHRSRLNDLVEQAYGHLDQWFSQRNAPYVRPFMVALTAHALIMHAEQNGDSRAIPALSQAADWLWEHTWLPQGQAFMYTDRYDTSGGQEPAPDLNLLIVPMFGWLYKQTGEQRFLERGDQIFAGGVRQAFLGNGKQFDQNYRWSFEYIRWRSEGHQRFHR